MIILFIVLLMKVSFANASTALDTFKDYLDKAQRQNVLTEARLINVGDAYLNEHAKSAERLSLAEFLPLSPKKLKEFCRTYPKILMDYYSLNDQQSLDAIKSPILNEYILMVKTQCQKAK